MATSTPAQNNGKYSFVARYGETIVRGGIAAIPYALYRYQGELKLTAQQVWFISAILGQKWTTQFPRPSLRKMAKQTGVSEVTLHKIKNELVGPDKNNPKWLIVRERKNPKGGKASSDYDFSPLFDKLVALLERDRPLPEGLEESPEEPEENPGDASGGTPADPHLNTGLDTHLNPPLEAHLKTGLAHNTETINTEVSVSDVYLSNIRKAKSDAFDFDTLHSTGEEPEPSTPFTQGSGEHSNNGQPYKNPEAVSLNTEGQTQIRNIEELEAIEKYRRSAAKLSDNSPPAPSGEPKRGGGLTHIGQTLPGRLPVVKPAVDDTVVREAIEGYIRDIAAKLHDEAPLKSSTSRAFNLYRQTGADLNAFFNLLYDAEKEANRRSATIKKVTSMGFKNRMAYFFAILEDRLGLRPTSAISYAS